MDYQVFVNTMIETLKFDEKFKEHRDKILPIIRRSKVNSIAKYAFAIRPGQHYEDVEIRVPIPLINEANKLKHHIADLVGYVYEESDDYALGSTLIKPQMLYSETQEDREHDVVFSEIEETIIQGIRDARFLIWAAVAWFTNKTIYDELLKKKEEGLNIRIAISDEETNSKLLPDLKANFELTVISRYGWNNYNRMHDKFCIIDLDYVMHGSYNWTPTANHNEETLATALDKDYVKKFADEFMRLFKKQC
ncbi:phospholipase D-like domain-containing protein [Cohnella hongkongensis]|uniref:phospholipase D n=1 Tax=Cohnella hongkongensis TaxID=178337 RepID=A0ABV9FAA7_9BACL